MKNSAQKEDRRTVKTKKALAAAFVILLEEKGYDDMTIQDLIDKADVGRSTFYAHYESKEQLLIGNINFKEALVDQTVHSADCPMGINLPFLFHHTKGHIHLFRIVSRSKGGFGVVGNYFADVCLGRILEHHRWSRMKKGREKTILYYKAEAAAGAVTRMLTRWLEDGAVLPAADMIAQAKSILAFFAQT
jgi:hypothetical protein